VGSSMASAESVFVKGRGKVDLVSLECNTVTGSPLIRRICYDWREQYLLLNVDGTYYEFCGVRDSTVDDLKSADSIEQYYSTKIEADFSCRVNRTSKY
jgi:hypothetical protein